MVSRMQMSSVPSLSILTFPRLVDGKVLLPLRPSSTLIGGFRHITVIPDPSQEASIPLYKLNALDALLDGLAGTTNDKVAVSARTIDAQVSAAAGKVLARSTSPYSAGLSPATGGVVDLVA